MERSGKWAVGEGGITAKVWGWYLPHALQSPFLLCRVAPLWCKAPKLCLELALAPVLCPPGSGVETFRVLCSIWELLCCS